jgi:hypothetical protein
MKGRQRLVAVSVIALTGFAVPAFAQRPTMPGDIPGPPTKSEPPVSKSDEHRIVGKVLQINRQDRLVKLATEEGNLTVEVQPPALLAFRVGDTVSVPRSTAIPPSASPRQ